MSTSEANELLRTIFTSRAEDFFGRFAIGDSISSMDAGARQILTGAKTTTSSLLSDFPDGRLPFAGALSVLEDGLGVPQAVVETTRVDRTPFGQLSANFVRDYGEGDGSVEWFRANIGDWYRRRDPCFSNSTVLVCEHFKVVHRF